MSWRNLLVLATVGAAAAASLFSAPVAEPASGEMADLGVTKSDSPDPVTVGSTLTYTIQVTNAGPQNATGVTVTDALPSQTDFLSATASSGNCDHQGNRVVCTIGDLAAKASPVTVTIQVRPTRTGTIANSVSVDGTEKDPVSGNDKAVASTTVIAAKAASCRGVAATLSGTPGADNLVGTPGRDVIAGLGGGDSIFGLAGGDLICAGGGADRVNAGAGRDRVFGGGGRDRLKGRGGPDLLAGNGRGDVLFGNAGNDRLKGGAGRDSCFGEAGRDVERSCER
jgi:uncharacterized repeat protein (TIGR01451 family)